MLKKTQMKIVLPYWKRLISALSLLDDLVNAPENELLFCWQGLDYYSRVKRLQELCIAFHSINQHIPLKKHPA